jgi:hypothetical protein
VDAWQQRPGAHAETATVKRNLSMLREPHCAAGIIHAAGSP